jgi:hypothetical protein
LDGKYFPHHLEVNGRGSGKLQAEEFWKRNWKTSTSKLLAVVWINAANPRVAVVGLISTGKYIFHPDILPKTAFFSPGSVSKRLLHCNMNRVQDIPSGSNNQERSEAHKEVAVARSGI